MARLPTQDNCDQGDPREAFQWAFVVLPFKGSTPLLVDAAARPEWSELFWNLGFRHHPELQTKKVQAPPRGQQHALNGAGSIVDVDEPEPDPVMIQDPAEFTRHEQQVQVQRLREAGAIPEPPRERQEARRLPTFDPRKHPANTVNGYLLAAGDGERRRVLALEMQGKRRASILQKPDWKGL